MNQYGQMAMRHWRRYRPVQYTQLANPADFFPWLGDQIRDQAAELAAQLTETPRTGESLLDRLSRLSMARLAAHQQAVAQPREDDPGE